jgi:hypothetical protein
MAIVIPNSTHRAWQRGFWLTAALGLGTAAGGLLWILTPSQRLAAGVLTAVVAAVPGLLRPRLAMRPLQAWNRAARLFTRVASTWVTGICFYVVIPALGRRRSALTLDPVGPGTSLWTPWRNGAGAGGGAVEGIAPANPSANAWAREFATWARGSGNPWASYLLPFLVVLTALEPPPDVELPPPGIYTLY